MIHQLFFSFGETIVSGWTIIGLHTLIDTSAPLHNGQSRPVLTWRILSPVGILVNDHSYGLLYHFISLFGLSTRPERAYILVDSREPIAVIILQRSSLIEFKIASTPGHKFVIQLLFVLHVPSSSSSVSAFHVWRGEKQIAGVTCSRDMSHD